MNQELLTIQEAAKMLGVSPTTLRRWEAAKILIPFRTVGNQRRYGKQQLEDFKSNKLKGAMATVSVPAQAPVIAPVAPQQPEPTHQPVLNQAPAHSLFTAATQNAPQTAPAHDASQSEKPFTTPVSSVFSNGFKLPEKVSKGYAKPFGNGVMVSLILLVGFIIAAGFAQSMGAGLDKFGKGLPFQNNEANGGSNANVLAAKDNTPVYTLRVNVPAIFGQKATFLDSAAVRKSLTVNGEAVLTGGIRTEDANIDAGTGRLTASNVVYSIVAGSNVAITGDPQNPVISANLDLGNTVTSFQGQSGAVSLTEGSGIGLDGLTITNTGVLSLQGQSGDVTFAQGSGIAISGLTITNSDPGSAQKIFGTFNINGTNITAGSNTDTFTFAAGSGVTLTPNTTDKSITISATTGTSSQWTTTGSDIYYNAGSVGIGNTAPAATLDVTGTGRFSGAFTLSALGTGVVQSDSNGLLSSAAINLAGGSSIVSGILPIANGGTGLSTLPGNGQLLIGNGTSYDLANLTGTANQISISNGSGSITFSTPQDIHTAATPTFSALSLTSDTNQIIFGSGNTGRLTFDPLTTNRTYTFPDASGTVCLTSGNCSGGGGGGIAGSGTTNYVAKFTSASGISDSSIFDNGKVGIGTTSPEGLLSVSGAPAGKALVSLNYTGAGQNILTASASGTTRLTLASNGTLNIIGGSYQIGGVDVLNSTTLGSVITSSSLTSVGVLGSGSITTGFGNIDIGADSITGGNITSTNGTGFTATGAGGGLTFSGSGNHDIQSTTGTLRLAGTTLIGAITGNGQNITGLNDLSAGGTVTFGGLGTGVVQSNGSGVLSSAALNLAGGASYITGTLPVANGGTGLTSFNTGDLLFASAGNTLSALPIGSEGQLLGVTGAGVPGWISSSAINFWSRTGGALSPLATSDDLLIGGSATSSAKFQVYGTTGSASTSGSFTFSNGGPIQSTRNQSLTIGGNTTGNIVLNPLNGSGSVISMGDLNLASGKTLQINGTNVLSATALGSGVTSSSLTTVGALASGSIASGFGTISTSNTITGTTLNGTTGINTGAGAGTQRISNTGNLVNIGTTQLNGITYTWPGADGSGDYVLTTNGTGGLEWKNVTSVGGAGDITAIGDVTSGAAFTAAGTQGTSLYFYDADGRGQLTIANLSAPRTYTLPDSSGTLCLLEAGNCAGAGGGITGSGTAGQIAFFTNSGNITSEASGFAWDSTNNKLGIGMDTPTGKLSVQGSSTGKALVVFDETGDQNIIVASASGTAQFILTRTGDLAIEGQLSDLSQNALTINDSLNLTAGNSFTIDGISVLSPTTLGGNIVNSSLTQVGALSAGSIASGFGTISTTNSIQGSDFTANGNGAGFTFSGTGNHLISASSGTLQIGAATLTGAITGNSQNITGLNNLSAAGQVTFSGLSTGVVQSNGSGVLSSAALNLAGGASYITGTLPVGNGGTGNTSVGSAGSVAYSNGSAYAFTAVGSSGQVLISNGSGAPSWLDASAVGTNYWQRNGGLLAPAAITDDFAIGGNSTSSAKFQIFANTGNASTSGNLTFANAGQIQSSSNQNLTFGGNTTGNIIFSPLNGAGTVLVNGNVNLASGNVYRINGSDVLSVTTLGSGVTGSSLTSVGALSSGSIATGFGTIQTNSSIEGSSLVANGNGAGLTFTGTGNHIVSASTGTLQFGAATLTGAITGNSQNITGLNNLSAGGTITFGGLGTGVVQSNSSGVLSSAALNLAGGSSYVTGTLPMGNGGTGVTSFTSNGVVYGNGANPLQVTSAPTGGQVLIGNNSGVPTFSTISGGFTLSDTGVASIVLTTTGETSTTSSNSGLEFSTGNGLSLLKGCSNNEILKWNDTTDNWVCSSDAGGAGSFVTVENNDSVVSGTADTLDFSTDFTVGASPSNEANISIADDILNFSELSDAMTLDAATSIALSNFNLTIGSSADIGSLIVAPDAGGKSALIVNKQGTGDIFTASSAGTTRFTIEGDGDLTASGTLTGLTGLTSSGTITFSNFTTNGGLLYTNGSGQLAQLGTVAAGQCLQSNGSAAPVWGSCADGSINFWDLNNGALSPKNTTTDFLIGGTSTASAKFAVLNVNNGTPTASVSAGVNGAAYLTAAGNLGTSNMQSLTLGGSTTGSINIDSGNGIVNIMDALTLAGNFTQSGAATFSTGTGSVSLNGNTTFASGTTITQSGTGQVTFGGNVDAQNGLDVTGADLNVGSGNATITTAGAITGTQLTIDNLGLNGNTFSTSTGDLTIDASDGNVLFANGDTLNVGGATAQAYNFFAGSTAGSSLGDGDNDLYVEDELEVDGAVRFDSATITLGNAGFANCTSLETSSGALTCGTDDNNPNYWQLNSGALSPANSTVDFLIGSTSSSSAKFAVLNVNNGTPTASVSAGVNGAVYLTAGGNLAATNNQALTLGGSQTGAINLDSGSGVINILDAVTLAGNFTQTGSGTFTSGTGLVTLNGNVDAVNGLDVTGASLTVGGTNATITTAGVITGTQGNVDNLRLDGNTLSATSGDLTIDAADGNLLLADNDTLNVGGAAAAAFNFFAGSTAGNNSADGDNDLYIEDELEVDGAVRFDSATITLGNAGFANCTSLETSSGALTCGTDDGGTNYWQIGSGTLSPFSNTLDLLVGGTASGSAKFAVLNMTGSGTPTASVSAGVGGNGAYLTAAGRLGTTNNQTLTLGGSGTGSIVIDSGNGTTSIQDNLLLAGTINQSGSGQVTFGGNVDANSGLDVTGASLTVGGSNAAITTAGAISGTQLDIDGTLRLDGTTLSTQGAGNDLTIDAAGSNVLFADNDTLNVGGAAAAAFNFFAGSTAGNSIADGDDDLYIADELEVDGAVRFDSATITLGNAGFANCTALTTVGNALTCGTDNGGTNYWQIGSGTLSPFSNTLDLLVGGTATNSAKFAVLNMTGSGTPTASVSAGVGGNAAYLTAGGNLATSNMQSLTVGGSTTGHVSIDSGNGVINLLDSTTIAGNLSASGTTGINLTGTNAGLSFSSGTNVIQSSGTLQINAFTLNGTITGGNNAINNIGNISANSSSNTITGFGTVGTSGTTDFVGNELTLAGASGADITSGTNEDLTITANGSGRLILSSDFNTGVSVGTGSNTNAPLSVSGGIGSNASFIVNNTNSGDLIAASASGTTRFRVANNGDIATSLTGSRGVFTDANGVLSTTGASSALANSLSDETGSGLAVFGTSPTLSTSLITDTTSFNLLNTIATTINFGGAGTAINIGASGTNVAFGSGGSATLSTTSNGSLTIDPASTGTGELTLASDFNSGVNIGASSNTPAVLSISGGLGSNAALIVNNTNSGDLITASASGTTRFTVDTNGNIGVAAGTTIDTLASGTLGIGTTNATTITIGRSGQGITLAGFNNCGMLTTTGTALQCSSAPSAGTNYWQIGSGVISPFSSTLDILGGGTASNSAKFAVLNMTGSGTPTASVSAVSNGTGVSMAGNGQIQAFRNNTLTIGGNTTGNIVLSPLSGSGYVLSTGDLNLSSGKGYQINGTTVLSGNTLGSTITASSLDSVDQLDAGSITSNFGSIDVGSDAISGGTITATSATGFVSTGASSGLTFQTGTGTHLISASAGTLQLGAFQLGGTVDGNSQTINSVGQLNVDNLRLDGNTFSATSGDITLDASGDDVIFTNADTINIGGSGSDVAYNVIGDNVSGASLNLNSDDDLFIEGDLDVAGSSSVSGTLTFRSGAAAIQSTGMATLTLGGTTTGNVVISPNGGSGAVLLNANSLSINGTAGSTISTASCVTTTNGIVTGTGTCQLGSEPWWYNTANGTISTGNNTVDVLFGGSASTSAKFKISQSGTSPTASVAGMTSYAALVVNNNGVGDLFTASKSGRTHFTIKNSGQVIIGDTTNGITFDAASGMQYFGNARATRQIVLSPEYAGAVLTASGSATTNGFMTSDASASATPSTYNFAQYYQWKSTQTSLQDYTVAVRVTLPQDFSAWVTSGTALSVDIYSNLNGTGSNKVDILAYRQSNGSVVVYDQARVSATNKNWTSRTFTASQLQALSAGDTVVFYLKMYSKDNNDVMIGDIKLNYLSTK